MHGLSFGPKAAIPARLDEIDPGLSCGPETAERRFPHRRHRARQCHAQLLQQRHGARARRSLLRVLRPRRDPRTAGIYRKQHLVPFGEFLPFPALFRWLLDSLRIPMSDFSTGAADQPPLTAAGQKIGVSVCCEDAFGEEIIRALPQATLLVNVSEDAWFGNSLAPHQRIQMARLRALESGRPMLRAANTGPSAVIDHRGEVTVHSRQFETAVLRATVQPMQGATPYVRWGNSPGGTEVTKQVWFCWDGSAPPARKTAPRAEVTIRP